LQCSGLQLQRQKSASTLCHDLLLLLLNVIKRAEDWITCREFQSRLLEQSATAQLTYAFVGRAARIAANIAKLPESLRKT